VIVYGPAVDTRLQAERCGGASRTVYARAAAWHAPGHRGEFRRQHSAPRGHRRDDTLSGSGTARARRIDRSVGRCTTGKGRGHPPSRGPTSARTGRRPEVGGQRGAGLVEVPDGRGGGTVEVLLDDHRCRSTTRSVGASEGAVGRGRTHPTSPPPPTPRRKPGRGERLLTPTATVKFEPALRPGELVAGAVTRFAVLAHGGLGWVYLAVDR